MSKVSFAAKPAVDNATQPLPPEDAATVAQFTADTTKANSLPAVVPPPQPPARNDSRFSDDPEDIDFSQLALPTLKIVQGVGDLSLAFDPGQIVIVGKGDVTIPLADAPPKAGAKGGAEQVQVNTVLIAISRHDRYSEKLPGGVRGRLYNTETEVLNNGGTTNWDENKANPAKSYFERLATAILLVEKPAALEDETGTFGFEAGGKQYALVVWHLKGISYTNAAKPLRTARRFGFLKAGYSSRVVKLGTALKSYGTNSAYIPTVAPGGDTPEELRGIVSEVLGK